MVHQFSEVECGSSDKVGCFIFDEMSIQEDLQVVRSGDTWNIVGAIDLGEMVNSLEDIYKRKKEVKMASHFILYLFVELGGFRWPVAYYATNNINVHQLYLTFWELVAVLQHYGFQVVYAVMDGSSNNRNFMHLMLPFANIRSMRFTHNPFNHKEKMIPVQDIKHCLKKIHNSLLSSSLEPSAKRTLTLDGNFIVWDHFREAYNFNSSHYIKLFAKLTKEHI